MLGPIDPEEGWLNNRCWARKIRRRAAFLFAFVVFCFEFYLFGEGEGVPPLTPIATRRALYRQDLPMEAGSERLHMGGCRRGGADVVFFVLALSIYFYIVDVFGPTMSPGGPRRCLKTDPSTPLQLHQQYIELHFSSVNNI